MSLPLGSGVAVLHFTIQVAVAYAYLAAAILLLIAAELAWPRECQPQLTGRITAILFSVIYIPFGILFVNAVRPIMGPPVFRFGILASAITAAVVGDLFYYWLHRAQHSFKLLWPFHAVHHSIEKLVAGSGFHHLAEAPLRALFVSVPLAFVTTRPTLATVLISFHGLYIHSMTRIHFGPLSRLVCDNRIHRLHHSLEVKHRDHNFAAFTPLWDMLFGTFHPVDGWPNVGLSDNHEPKNVREYALRPFTQLFAFGTKTALPRS
jgi:sterol desaturase/sphingolipid hydroxylase (fatty acid hydroxylase superfamily)